MIRKLEVRSQGNIIEQFGTMSLSLNLDGADL